MQSLQHILLNLLILYIHIPVLVHSFPTQNPDNAVFWSLVPQNRRGINDPLKPWQDYLTGDHDLIRQDFMPNPGYHRRHCIFYVNQIITKTMNKENPLWGRNSAGAFALLQNGISQRYSYVTLYHLYDRDRAFGDASPMMVESLAVHREREWFTESSVAYAELCEGEVFLVVEADPNAILPYSIWNQEHEALLRTGRVTRIWEIRPEEIAHVLEHGGSVPRHPYRGGHPSRDPVDEPTEVLFPPHAIDLAQVADLFRGYADPCDDNIDLGTTPTGPKTPSPYKEGPSCGVTLTQYHYLPGRSQPFGIDVQSIVDNGDKDIGGHTNGAIEAGDSKPLEVKSKLENPLRMTPEEQNDYIQFDLGNQHWQSSDSARCQLVTDWKQLGDIQWRQVKCTFECYWGGTRSSDGSYPDSVPTGSGDGTVGPPTTKGPADGPNPDGQGTGPQNGNVLSAGALVGEEAGCEVIADRFKHWASAVIGLLAANLFVLLVLLILSLKGCITRGRTVSPMYKPVRTKDTEGFLPPSAFHRQLEPYDQ
ncbi:hypothetical protein DL96DRAFT_1775685 [Flagelloscypha sp. PMI_526]|nr:hypothetical protein DL96DRAFT_1775685 [Flagelloscypha sp. PMI_526]